jgi:hypothetical protein
MRLGFSTLALLSVIIAVSGCRSFLDPSPMPAGYAYHQQKYKSPPGPPAADIGYPFSVDRNDVVVEKWQAVASRIVDQMEQQLALGPRAIYIEPLPRPNAFNTSLDYVLREELRNRGYTLVAVPGSGLHLKPEIYLPGDEKIPVDANMYNDDPHFETIPANRSKAHEFLITVNVLENKVYKGAVEGQYTLPAYGYVRGDGSDRLENKDAYKKKKAAAKPVPQAAPDYAPPAGENTVESNEPAPLVPVNQEPI